MLKTLHTSEESQTAGMMTAQGGVSAMILRLLSSAQNNLEIDREAALLDLARASSLLSEPAPATTRGGLAGWQKRRLHQHIEENLESRLSQADLAALVKLSVGHFSRSFRQSFGETVHAYIIARRMERAKQMMLSTQDSLCQIALACGLADQAHFSRRFRAAFGTTPQCWRRAHAAAPQRRAMAPQPTALHAP